MLLFYPLNRAVQNQRLRAIIVARARTQLQYPKPFLAEHFFYLTPIKSLSGIIIHDFGEDFHTRILDQNCREKKFIDGRFRKPHAVFARFEWCCCQYAPSPACHIEIFRDTLHPDYTTALESTNSCITSDCGPRRMSRVAHKKMTLVPIARLLQAEFGPKISIGCGFQKI